MLSNQNMMFGLFQYDQTMSERTPGDAVGGKVQCSAHGTRQTAAARRPEQGVIPARRANAMAAWQNQRGVLTVPLEHIRFLADWTLVLCLGASLLFLGFLLGLPLLFLALPLLGGCHGIGVYLGHPFGIVVRIWLQQSQVVKNRSAACGPAPLANLGKVVRLRSTDAEWRVLR